LGFTPVEEDDFFNKEEEDERDFFTEEEERVIGVIVGRLELLLRRGVIAGRLELDDAKGLKLEPAEDELPFDRAEELLDTGAEDSGT
jgi:hypothetical protein